MAMSVTGSDPLPNTTAPVAKNLFQSTLKGFYPNEQEFYVCRHPFHGQGLLQSFSYDKVNALAREVLIELRNAARLEKKSWTITIEGLEQEKARGSAYVLLQLFQNNLDISVKGWTEAKEQHTLLCDKSSITVTLFWGSSNPFIFEKPILSLSSKQPWGLDKLNEERKEGIGTNCTLVFGEGKSAQSFAVHDLIIEQFCEWFKIQKGFAEGEKKKFDLPKVVDFTKEELDAFVSYIYTKKLDLCQFPARTAIHLLKLSFYLNAENLRSLTFNHLKDIAQDLKPSDRLYLCYTSIEKPFQELVELCQWLIEESPNFYEEILNGDEVQSEDLLMLFAIFKRYKIADLKEPLEASWKELTTEEKTLFINAAIVTAHVPLLRSMDTIGARTCRTMNKDDPKREEFIAAYRILHEKVFIERTKTDVSLLVKKGSGQS